MSITLEQVIADCKKEISDCQIDLDGISELLEEYPERKEAFAHEIDDYKKHMDYNRQLAEWLKILKKAKFEYDEAWRIITHPTPDVRYPDIDRAKMILDVFRDSLGRMD